MMTSTSTRPRQAASTGMAKTKKKSTSLPPETVEYLKNWMMSPEHIAHPYPTEQEKAQIMQETGIELKQLTNWFVNNRKRYWKPRVEARLQQQQQQTKVNSKDPSPTTAPLPTSKDALLPTVSSPVAVMAKALSKVISNSSMESLVGDKSQEGEAISTVTPVCSPGRRMTAVSETSSTASDSASVSSSSSSASSASEDEMVGEQEHTIRIDLHLLKPYSGAEPTEADMTTLSNIPQERILRSFRNCYITYRIPADATLLQVRKISPPVCPSFDFVRHNRLICSNFCFVYLDVVLPLQEQSRRDAELMRLKKQFLATYFAEKSAAEAAAAAENSKKRSAPCPLLEAIENVSPRPKYRRVSLDTWKTACKKACHVYDESLPSLEEATKLFGYTSN